MEELLLNERKVRLAKLLSFYAKLLTENQREIATLFTDEDYSLAELAEQFHITRQGVYDAVSKAEKTMLQFEEKLNLISHYETLRGILGACITELESIAHANPDFRVGHVLDNLRSLIEMEDSEDGI